MKKKFKFSIAVDGGSASGKSTGSKYISKNFGFKLLSSGKLYRYLAYQIIKNKLNYNNKFIKKIAKSITIEKLNKKNLYFSDVTKLASIIAKKKYVRNHLKKFQIDFIKKNPKVIIEGRDIASKIMPNADLKIFFECSINKKAKRRLMELKKLNYNLTLKEVKKALKTLRKGWKETGLSESLDVRMGIHTDVCTVGNFGSKDRLDYTVLGNGVNLASRLESSASSNEILISENTYNLVKNEIKCNYYDKIQVKGKSHPIKTFQVVRKVQNKKVIQKINAASEGFSLSIDKKKIKDIDEIISVLENSIDKLTD